MAISKWTEENVNNPSFSSSTEEVVTPPVPNWESEVIEQEITLVSDRIPASLPLQFIEGGIYDATDGFGFTYSSNNIYVQRPSIFLHSCSITGDTLSLGLDTSIKIGGRIFAESEDEGIYNMMPISDGTSASTLIVGHITNAHLNTAKFNIKPLDTTNRTEDVEIILNADNQADAPNVSQSIFFQHEGDSLGGIQNKYTTLTEQATITIGAAGDSDSPDSDLVIQRKPATDNVARIALGHATPLSQLDIRDGISIVEGATIRQSKGVNSANWESSVLADESWIFGRMATAASIKKTVLKINTDGIYNYTDNFFLHSAATLGTDLTFAPNDAESSSMWKLSTPSDGSSFAISLSLLGEFVPVITVGDDKSLLLAGSLNYNTQYKTAADSLNDILITYQLDATKDLIHDYKLATGAATKDNFITMSRGTTSLFTFGYEYNGGTERFIISKALDPIDALFAIERGTGAITIGEWRADPIDITYGGTGGTTAGEARTALGLVIGTDVRDMTIDTTPTDGSTNPIDSNAVFDGLATKQASIIGLKNDTMSGTIMWMDATSGVSITKGKTLQMDGDLSTGIGGDTYIQCDPSDGDILDITVGSNKMLSFIESLNGAWSLFKESSAGFTLATPTYNATDTDVDFRESNKARVIFDGGDIVDLNFLFPDVTGNFSLILKQDATGGRTVDFWKAFEFDATAAAGSTTLVWSGGDAPTLTTTGNKVDIISIYWDNDSETAYATISYNF